MNQVAEYISLAFLLPISAVIGWLLGGLLDKTFGTHWIYIFGLLVGIAAGFIELIRQLMRDTRDNDG